MHIDNQDIIPIDIKKVSDSAINIKTKNSKFDEVLKKHKIKKFHQAFPTAPGDWLKNVYYVKSSSKLSKEIK